MKIDIKGKYVIKAIIIFMIFYCSIYIQYFLASLFKIKVSEITKSEAIMLNFISDIIVSIIYFIIYYKDLKKEFKIFKDNWLENLDTGLVYWLVGLVIMLSTNLIIGLFFKASGANNEKAVREMIRTLPYIMLLNAGVIAPFNEEILFRKSLKDITNNKWLFVLLSFLLFGGAHVISSAKVLTDYLYIVPYGVLGISFALAYYKTKTVFTSMFFHMFHNTALTLLQIFLL